MSRYKLSLNEAKKLQKWALEVSGAKKILDKLPEIKDECKNKPGIYVSYEIDKEELDDEIDHPTPAVASVWVVDDKGEETHLGTVRAYNLEAYWLETDEHEQVDDAEEWWKIINEDNEKLKKMLEDENKDKNGNDKL